MNGAAARARRRARDWNPQRLIPSSLDARRCHEGRCAHHLAVRTGHTHVWQRTNLQQWRPRSKAQTAGDFHETSHVQHMASERASQPRQRLQLCHAICLSVCQLWQDQVAHTDLLSPPTPAVGHPIVPRSAVRALHVVPSPFAPPLAVLPGGSSDLFPPKTAGALARGSISCGRDVDFFYLFFRDLFERERRFLGHFFVPVS